MALMFLSMEHLHVHVHAAHAEPTSHMLKSSSEVKAICILAIRMFCFAASLPLPHKLKANILDEVIHTYNYVHVWIKPQLVSKHRLFHY